MRDAGHVVDNYFDYLNGVYRYENNGAQEKKKKKSYFQRFKWNTKNVRELIWIFLDFKY